MAARVERPTPSIRLGFGLGGAVDVRAGGQGYRMMSVSEKTEVTGSDAS